LEPFEVLHLETGSLLLVAARKLAAKRQRASRALLLGWERTPLSLLVPGFSRHWLPQRLAVLAVRLSVPPDRFYVTELHPVWDSTVLLFS
jgi:hypothetical protein